MAAALHEHLDPHTVARLESLELVARTLVQGFLKGLHLSASKGSSIEFAEHRPYVPGDDIRRIDWRTFGRTDRYYLKEYDDETNVRATLFLDASASMAFRSGEVSKLRYSVCLAAALGYLLFCQRDAVGLVVGGATIRKELHPRATARQLKGIFANLESTTGEGETRLGECLHLLAERIHPRSLVIVLSDFLDDPRSTLRGAAHLRHRGAEVLLFQILDPAEEDFPFTNWTLFVDSESPGRRVRVDARQLREIYLENLSDHIENLRKGATALEADYMLLNTGKPFEVALARYLDLRQCRGKR